MMAITAVLAFASAGAVSAIGKSFSLWLAFLEPFIWFGAAALSTPLILLCSHQMLRLARRDGRRRAANMRFVLMMLYLMVIAGIIDASAGFAAAIWGPIPVLTNLGVSFVLLALPAGLFGFFAFAIVALGLRREVGRIVANRMAG